MKTAALLLAATLMTIGGAWVQAQSTTNVNQTGNHTNNRNDPGQQSDESDKLDNKGKLVHDGKASKTRTDKRTRRGKPTANHGDKPLSGAPTEPPASTPAVPSIPIAPTK
ncbi:MULTISPECIES: hypothetical protein [unclassified Janthinobacterium]|jgi:hypothetical protein|uniref:hypothetical protein n=1 Tax=unclassified Janthinobacterium TaxID=2610881 RepID=UPI001E3054C8|nr:MULTISPECIES: hypothetical protein [unclassified Janthinobacterium]MCC7644216.1 hypothetical protein [Janthinobacterium sp. EB271-G4-3-1]MCC7693256.1 hypothetical protein [Janthinobacterium sp. EB271-G4-3-2]